MTEPTRWLNDEAVAPSMRRLLGTGAGEIHFPDDVRKRVATRLAVLTGTAFVAASATQVVHAATSATANATTMGATLAGVKGLAAVISVVLSTTVAAAVVVKTRQPIVPVATPEIAWTMVDALETKGKATFLMDHPFALRPIGELPWTIEELPEVDSVGPRRDGRAAPLAGTLVAGTLVSGKLVSGKLGDAFEREVKALREARNSLHADPSRALQLLRSHERQFGAGQLTAEGRLLEVRALLALGQRSEAETVGLRLLGSESARPYHARVRALLGKRAAKAKDESNDEH